MDCDLSTSNSSREDQAANQETNRTDQDSQNVDTNINIGLLGDHSNESVTEDNDSETKQGAVGSSEETFDSETNQGAVGGSDETFDSETRQGAVGGSEETFDTICQPCLDDDKHVESLKYCVECAEYLCEQCVNMHKGVRLTRKHKMILKEEVDKYSEARNCQREVCSLHGNECIEWFCEEHDALVCKVCKTLSHNECEIKTICDASSTYDISETITKLEEAKTLLCKTIQNRETLKESLETDKQESVQTLQKINEDAECAFKHIQTLVQKDTEKTENIYRSIKNDIQNDIERHTQIQLTVESSLRLLKSNLTRESLFIHGRQADANLEQISHIISESQTKHFRKIELERENELDSHLQALQLMLRTGCVDQEKMIYKLIDNKQITLPTKSGKENAYLTSLCFTENNEIIAVDWTNSCLYLFDNLQAKVLSTLQLKHKAFDICKAEGKYVVSLLHACVLKFFRHTGSTIKLDDQADIYTVERCRGICYQENTKLLFVACGGGGLANEGPGHIRVYSLDGKHQKTITENIDRPWKIRIQETTNMLCVSGGGRLLSIQQKENDQYDCTVLQTDCCGEFCFDDSGRIIVPIWQYDDEDKTLDVCLLTRNAEFIETLVEKNVLGSEIACLIFDNKSCCLNIAYKNNCIHQLKFKMNDWKQGPSVK